MRQIDKLLQSAATSGNGNVHDLRGTSHEVAFYVIGAGTITSGEVQLETADDPAYAGTWHALDSAITVVSSAQIYKSFTGVFNAVRARISTAIGGGGSVTVRLIAK